MDQGPLPTDTPLVVAVVSSSPAAAGNLNAICAELGRALGREISGRVLGSYAELSKEIAAGKAHVAWAPPLVAIEMERSALTSIALCCTRGGEAGYHAAIFTRHASSIEKLSDLKGSHVAWVDRNSSAGYLVPRMRLASAGLDPARLFGRESFLGTHESVACAVLDGQADVGATYISLDPRTRKPMSAGWLEAGAGVNGAFIVATAGPIPADAIVLANSLGDELKAAVTKAFVALPTTAPEPLSGLLHADGFVIPPREHFEALRAMVAALASP